MLDLGQVFTRGMVAKYMVSLFDLPRDASIMDPCFGEGAFLDALLKSGYSDVTACEMDSVLFDAVSRKYENYKLFNGDFLKFGDSNTYDGVIMNPPYIRQEKIDELEEYGITKKVLRSNSIFSGLPSTANMYMYFILKAVDLLKIDGQLIVIFPSSWMNSKSGQQFKETMFAKCGVERCVHICGDVFEQGALVEVVILKLRKGKFDLISCEENLEVIDGDLIFSSQNKNSDYDLFNCKFSQFATVKRGLTTGCNEMYINPDLPAGEEVCCKYIVSTPKAVVGYTTKNARLDRLLLPKKEELTEPIKRYLALWEDRICLTEKPKTLYKKLYHDERWYELREKDGTGIWFSYFVRNDMKFIMNETGVIARDNFYVISPKIDKWVLFALLNNYYTFYQLEMIGKRYGAGLLKLQRYDIEDLTFPEFKKMAESDRRELANLGHKLVESASSLVIDEITMVISKYSNITFDDIKERYISSKSNRLGVNLK